MCLLKSSLCVVMVLALGTGAAVAMSGSCRPALGDSIAPGRPQGVENIFVTDPEDLRAETWVEKSGNYGWPVVIGTTGIPFTLVRSS